MHEGPQLRRRVVEIGERRALQHPALDARPAGARRAISAVEQLDAVWSPHLTSCRRVLEPAQLTLAKRDDPVLRGGVEQADESLARARSSSLGHSESSTGASESAPWGGPSP